MKTIVLSAGHHAARQGASNKNYNLTEYVCASEVVLLASKKLIDDNVCEVHIVDGTLSHKVKYINEYKFDLALDYHFNADADHLDPDDNDDSRGRGCMVMYVPNNSTRKHQAASFSSSMVNSLSTIDKGAREGWYWGGDNPGTIKDYFLRKTNCPAFIPEAGYIDNNGFAKEFLLTNDGYERLADALVDAIKEFLSC